MSADCQPGFSFNLKTQLDGQPDCPENPEVIFAEAFIGVSNGPDDLFLEVLASADKIEQLFGDGVPKHAVDGEITTHGIFFGGCKGDFLGVASVPVVGFGPEGCDFHLFSVEDDHYDAESGPDFEGFLKEGDNLFGLSVGDDVIVFGSSSEEIVSDAAAGKKGLVALLPEALDDGQGLLPI